MERAMEIKTDTWWEAHNSGWSGVDEDGNPLSWFTTSEVRFDTIEEAIQCNKKHSINSKDIKYRVVKVTITKEIYKQEG